MLAPTAEDRCWSAQGLVLGRRVHFPSWPDLTVAPNFLGLNWYLTEFLDVRDSYFPVVSITKTNLTWNIYRGPHTKKKIRKTILRSLGFRLLEDTTGAKVITFQYHLSQA